MMNRKAVKGVHIHRVHQLEDGTVEYEATFDLGGGVSTRQKIRLHEVTQAHLEHDDEEHGKRFKAMAEALRLWKNGDLGDAIATDVAAVLRELTHRRSKARVHISEG